ncbi:MAG TPA: DUF4397 domain-containing protein [Mucilaginibacter sp.]|nr:DUF4397 domain-containing protein [Mucilaginibacter sp.]
MKFYKNTSKRLVAGLGVVCLLSVLLSSCLKTNDEIYNPPPSAFVSFIHATPDIPPLDFYLDNNRVNANPLIYGSYIDYFRAFTGTRAANFYNQGTTTKVISDTLHLKQDSAYSVYLVKGASHPEVLTITDLVSKPTAGNASIRFVNVSPDAPAVNFAKKDSVAMVSSKSFKGYTGFMPIKGDATYTFEVRQTGTNTVLATLASVKLNSGFVYTIYFHGLVGGTTATDKLAADIITNAYYN